MTDYDALNRPITVTLNDENGDPLIPAYAGTDAANQDWATITDTDHIQVTRYTADGQVAAIIENYVDGVFDPADPVHDRRTTYAYDALGRLERTVTTEEDGNPATGGTDTDQVTATAYDSAGRLQGRQDPLARWGSQQYDALSRVSTTIQNCRDDAGNPVASGCATQTAQRNVRQQTRYDALGRVLETEDALGTVTRLAYDGVGCTVATTQNYVAGGPSDSATNVKRNVSIALRQIAPEFRVHRVRRANGVNRPQDSRPPGRRPGPLRCPPWTPPRRPAGKPTGSRRPQRRFRCGRGD